VKEASDTPELVAHITLRNQDGALYARGVVPVVNGAVDLSELELEGEGAEAEGEGAEGE